MQEQREQALNSLAEAGIQLGTWLKNPLKKHEAST
jgi:hypothetical protein